MYFDSRVLKTNLYLIQRRNVRFSATKRRLRIRMPLAIAMELCWKSMTPQQEKTLEMLRLEGKSPRLWFAEARAICVELTVSQTPAHLLNFHKQS